MTGNLFDDEGNPGDELSERIYSQADAAIHGVEEVVTYNTVNKVSLGVYSQILHVDDWTGLGWKPSIVASDVDWC